MGERGEVREERVRSLHRPRPDPGCRAIRQCEGCPSHLSPTPATMKITLALLSLAAAATAYPMFLLEEEPLYRVPRQLPQDRPQLGMRRSDQADLQTAADAAYGAAPVGRVKIQVYRGPSKGEGYDVFAPWGYYNTQPADLAIHH